MGAGRRALNPGRSLRWASRRRPASTTRTAGFPLSGVQAIRYARTRQVDYPIRSGSGAAADGAFFCQIV